jgi:hypothetical protein
MAACEPPVEGFKEDWRYPAFIAYGMASKVGALVRAARLQAFRRKCRQEREAELKARWVLHCAALRWPVCCAALSCVLWLAGEGGGLGRRLEVLACC